MGHSSRRRSNRRHVVGGRLPEVLEDSLPERIGTSSTNAFFEARSTQVQDLSTGQGMVLKR